MRIEAHRAAARASFIREERKGGDDGKRVSGEGWLAQLDSPEQRERERERAESRKAMAEAAEKGKKKRIGMSRMRFC
jgi:hypothetical protein